MGAVEEAIFRLHYEYRCNDQRGDRTKSRKFCLHCTSTPIVVRPY